MKKAIGLLRKLVADARIKIHHGKVYLYRISSVNIDRVTIEKHLCYAMNIIDRVGTNSDVFASAELNEETKVGIIVQKMKPSLIADISKRVDEVAINFEMDGKVIKSFDFEGVEDI